MKLIKIKNINIFVIAILIFFESISFESFVIRANCYVLSANVNLLMNDKRGGTVLDVTGNQEIQYFQSTNAKNYKSIGSMAYTTSTQLGTFCELNTEIKKIKVLNVYPVSAISQIPDVDYIYKNGVHKKQPLSASLKLWMEGGSIIYQNGTCDYLEGKNTYNNQEIMTVDELSWTDFNDNSNKYGSEEYYRQLKKEGYNVIFFGTYDINAGCELNNSATEVVRNCLVNKDIGIVCGHDTIGYDYGKNGLGSLASYFGIEVGNYFYDLDYVADNLGDNVDYKTGWAYASTQVELTEAGSKSVITTFPRKLDIGQRFTVPITHTCANAVKDKNNVIFELVDGYTYPSPLGDGKNNLSVSNYFNAGGQGNPQYFLTINNNTAMIQTGNSNCESTDGERTIIANLLMNVAQRTTMKNTLDYSSSDTTAPDMPKISVACNNDDRISLAMEAADNGTDYWYYAKVYDKSSGKYIMDTNTVQTKVTTGVNNYYYIMNDQSNYDFDIKNAECIAVDENNPKALLDITKAESQGKYIHVKVSDYAGNVSEVTDFCITTPTITGLTNVGWTNQDVTVTVNGNDSEYGVLNLALYDTTRNAGLSQNKSTFYNGRDYSMVFNPDYYRNNYEDLTDMNDDELLQHFVNYGMIEGRRASENFDVELYKRNNRDLADIFENDSVMYYLHYIDYGALEERIASESSSIIEAGKSASYHTNIAVTKYQGKEYGPVYNAAYYRSHNMDLQGMSDSELLQHFVEYGMKEGRQACAEFNLEYYKNAYDDLKNYFAENNQAYYAHFLDFGIEEGRIGNVYQENQVLNGAMQLENQYIVSATEYNGIDYAPVFNASYYKQRYYSELWDFSDQELLKHFVEYGMKEGRQANVTFHVIDYKNRYEDIAASFGNDLKAYYLHFINFGNNEGRQVSNVSSISHTFTNEGKNRITAKVVNQVGNNNIKSAFINIDKSKPEIQLEGDLADAQIGAFVKAQIRDSGSGLKSVTMTDESGNQLYSNKSENVGCNAAVYEDTDYSNVFNASFYKSKYVTELGKMTDEELLVHFVKYGMAEGRQASADFSLSEYKKNNVDLVQAYGGNNKEFYLHYLSAGAQEGRLASTINQLSYKITTPGTHQYTITAVDNVGNVAQDTMTVKVKDLHPEEPQNITYTVNHFVMDTNGEYGANATTTVSESIESGTEIQLSDLQNKELVSEGIHFAYAQIGSDIANQFVFTQQTKDVVINLYYSRELYKVFYHADTNGGTMRDGESGANDIEAIPVYYGGAVSLDIGAQKSEWEFIGWNTDADETQKMSTSLTMGSSDINLYALYQRNLTATFIDCKGQQSKQQSTTVIYNNDIEGSVIVPAISEYQSWENVSGVKAVGWGMNVSNCELLETQKTTIIANNRTFYAIYSATATMTFDSMGGKEIEPVEGTVYTSADNLELVTPVETTLPDCEKKGKTGYLCSFQGWSLNNKEDNNKEDNNKEDNNKEDNKEDNNKEDSKKQGAEYVSDTADDKLLYLKGELYNLYENTTLYAIYSEKPIHYCICYNLNGGQINQPDDMDVVYDQEFLITEKIPEKTGMLFESWNTKQDGTGQQYLTNQAAKNLTSISEDKVNLFAVWRKKKFHCIQILSKTASATQEQRMEIPSDLLPSGWYTQIGSKSLSTIGEKVNEISIQSWTISKDGMITKK